MRIPEIDSSIIARLIGDMNDKGYGTVLNFVQPEELERMRAFVRSSIDKAGRQYVAFTGSQAVTGSALDEFAASHSFRALFQRLYEAGTGQTAPEVRFHQVLRCLTGSKMKSHSMKFHYDSYVVTGLMPIEIPTEGKTGDLIMLPNTRRIRTSYLANLWDKTVLDNPVSQRVLRFLSERGKLPLMRIKMIPGHLYFFWGYRSIHTNEACDAEKVRATALFHYADPHEESRLKVGLKRGSGNAR